MRKIRPTKTPTIKQMIGMAVNLSQKYRKGAAIELQCQSWHNVTNCTQFWVYIEDLYGEHVDTWEEVIEWYRKMMEK